MLLNLPPKEHYTLNETLDYLEKFYGENRIDILYLLHQARKGKLRTVINLRAGRIFDDLADQSFHHRARILTINDRQVDSIYYLVNGNTELIYNQHEDEEKIHDGIVRHTEYNIERPEFSLLFTRDNISPKYNSHCFSYEIVKTSDNKTICDIHNFYFCGYFELEAELYEPSEERVLIDGYIIKPGLSKFNSVKTKENEYISFETTLPDTNISSSYRYRCPDLRININDILILHTDLIEFLGNPSSPDSKHKIGTPEEIQSELSHKTNLLIQKDKEIEILKTELSDLKSQQQKPVEKKSETSYLNIIQALKEELLAEQTFKNQDQLIAHLSHKYQSYIGLSESNLRDKFSKANKII